MFDFPNSPTLGQVYNGYTWDGEKWGVTFNAPNQGGVIAIKVFTASGTYTPSPNMTTCVIECVGGGGGGGGTSGSLGTQFVGGGGGSGSYSRLMSTAATIGTSQVITIGNAGAGGVASSNGTAGGDVSVGSLCVAKGGGGGGYGAIGIFTTAGAGGVSGTGDIAIPGEAGGLGISTQITTVFAPGGAGGSSHLGAGGVPSVLVSGASANGVAGSIYGAGGSGGNSHNITTTSTGGNGARGVVVITEYGLTSLGSSTAASGAVRYDLPQGLTATQQAQARSNIAGVGRIRVTKGTSSGTFNTDPNLIFAVLECVGGGGGGGGAAANTTANSSGGGGGGAGGYSRVAVTKAVIGGSIAVTIGAAGGGATAGANNGGAGGDTSIGSLCIAKGGQGGFGSVSGGGAGGGSGGVTTGGVGDITASGAPGMPGFGLQNIGTNVAASGGSGGSSIFGGGGVGPSAVATPSSGNPGTGNGSGGSGGASWISGAAVGGAAGASGMVVITEYCSA